MNLTALDVVFIVLIALFTLRCFLKGFIHEFFSIAAIVLGLIASLYFYKSGGEFVRNRFMPETKTIPEIIAFIALFVIIFFVMKILEFMLKDIVEGIELGGVDRFLGILFGFIEGMVVVSLVLFIIRIQPLFDPSPLLADSLFARAILPLITDKGIFPGV
jgi:membrane protein required for colicin V production